jgi:iron complex outermembrane receptor protein
MRRAAASLSAAAAMLAFACAAAHAATAPVEAEALLETLRRERGYSFIFDSRLVRGKVLSAPEEGAPSTAVLRLMLRDAGLILHQIAPRTFAIVAAPPKTFGTQGHADEGVETINPPIDTVLVLGSARVANAATGSKRIFDIDADDLAYLSVTSPAEAIYDLPQSLASFTPSNTALNGATAGISLADLRGLGPKRTVVLVNGRRRTLTTGGNGRVGGVDLNSIAEPFLERIEVQNLPGGARYGAGAVAGAVNFVTKSEISGIEGGARLGISERGDSEQISLHAIAGRTFEGVGNITVGVNATRAEGLIGADRPFSAVPYGFGRNGVKTSYASGDFLPGYGGSATTGRGSIGGVILSDSSFAPLPGGRAYVPNTDGSVSPYIGALDQLFNWAAFQNTVLPTDRLIGLASFNGELADDWRIFVETQAAISATDVSLAPLPGTRLRGGDPVAGDAAVIPLSNPFLPQSVRDLAAANFGAAATGIVFDHRYVELGTRRNEVDRRYFDIIAGVERGDQKTSKVSFTYRYGDSLVKARDFDRIDRNRLQVALDPAECATTTGCSLVDFFTTPEISPAALEFITMAPITRNTSIDEHEVALAASRPLRFREDFDGRVAAGVELRRSTLRDRDDVPAGALPLGYLGGADNRNAVNSLDAYAEIETPLYRSEHAPGEIDASLAVRLTKSTRFDYSMNFEAGVDWRPVEGVALFTRQHVGERTPDLIELFSIGPTLETAFLDPCGLSATQQDAVIAANCASPGPFGVGAGFVQIAPLASATFYGNPDLEPEKTRTSVYGASVEPTTLFPVIPGKLQVTATWFDFEIKDAINEFGDVLDACYSSPDFSSPACGVNPRTGAPNIRRDPSTRQVASYDETLQNEGSFSWRGLDFELRYAAQPDFLPSIDSVWLSALHTYAVKVESEMLGVVSRRDGLIDFPHHRTLLSAGADAGRLSVVAYATRRGKAATSRSAIPEARIPAAIYLDMTARFDLSDAAFVQASVKNITDQEPAITAFNDIGNFAPEFYDPVGRRYVLSVRVSF